jgi:hypothetical protein
VLKEQSDSAWCWHCGPYAAAFGEFGAHGTDQHYASDDCGDIFE